MKTYRKICAIISLAIIYGLVHMNVELELWEHIVWFFGVLCYCIAFRTGEDD